MTHIHRAVLLRMEHSCIDQKLLIKKAYIPKEIIIWQYMYYTFSKGLYRMKKNAAIFTFLDLPSQGVNMMRLPRKPLL